MSDWSDLVGFSSRSRAQLDAAVNNSVSDLLNQAERFQLDENDLAGCALELVCSMTDAQRRAMAETAMLQLDAVAAEYMKWAQAVTNAVNFRDAAQLRLDEARAKLLEVGATVGAIPDSGLSCDPLAALKGFSLAALRGLERGVVVAERSVAEAQAKLDEALTQQSLVSAAFSEARRVLNVALFGVCE